MQDSYTFERITLLSYMHPFPRIAILIFLLIVPIVSSYAQVKLVITPLMKDFYVFTTFSSYGGSLFPSNGMYVVTNEGVVLVDTPWDTTQLVPLIDSIKTKHGKEVIMAIATHSHEDRTACLEMLAAKGVKTFTSKLTHAISIEHNQPLAQHHFENDTTFYVGEKSFQTFYPGEGHTKDNIVIWFGPQKIIYGGCFVKSTEAQGLGNVADANLAEWSTSIERVKKRFSNPIYVIPGHQSWTRKDGLEHTLKLLSNK
jgi:metallo-beta-lactamase class B